MITKILDRYYTCKLKQYIDDELIRWQIDHKYINTKHCVHLHVKKVKYNKEQYQDILVFHKKEALSILCNQQELRKEIKERVNEYLELC